MAGSELILDTCALLWLVGGSPKLSSGARERIDAAATVGVCAISGFELGLKYRKGQLVLPVPPLGWLEAAAQHHQLSILPLDATVCVRSTELPPIHRDPADRLIIAMALERRSPVVTADAIFAEYGVETLA